MPFKSEKQRKWMHANEPEMAKKWEKKKKNEAERDYKDEYKKFQSSTKAKKYRAELNKYNRKKGTYGNGDGKDASHKGGKIVGFESQSKNRGRAEKSRLKKESPDFNPMIDKILDEVIDEYQLNEGPNQMTQIYKDLDKKFKQYDHTRIQHFGKVSKYLKDKFSKGSSLPDTIASFYNDYRGGEDMKKNIAKLTKYAKKMKGYAKESVNERRQYQSGSQEMNFIVQQLVKYGNTKSDAIKMTQKHYNHVIKRYRNSHFIHPTKKAEIISSLSANESVNEGRPKYGKLKLTKEKPKKITQWIWSAPKRIMSKRAWLRMPDMNKKRRDGVDYVATNLGPKKTQVYIPVIFESVNERTRMKPQVKRLLKQKGYAPIFQAIDNSKRQLKQMRYSRGEIQDTLIDMFGDEDPKILQKIKESVNEAKYKGYDYKRQNRKDGLPLIVPALRKTFSNMKDLKKYIDKHGTMEGVNEDVYYGYYKNKEVKVNAKSDKDAKKQIISKLKIPKGDLKRASMINHTKNQFKLESVNEKVTYHDGGRTVGIDVRDIYDYMVALKKTNPTKFKKDMKHKVLKGIWDRYSKGGEMYKEADLGLTYKKGKTVKVKHKTSGKSLIIIDKPNVRKEYEKIGFFAEGSCGYGIDGKVGSQPAGPHLIKKKKKKVDEAVIKVDKDPHKGVRNTPKGKTFNPLLLKGEDKIKALVWSGSYPQGKGSYELKGNKLNVNGINPRDKGFYIAHFTKNTKIKRANLYYDGVHWQDKNKKF